MAIKITRATELQTLIGQKAAGEFSKSVTRARPGRSYNDLLSEMYAQADELLQDIRHSDESPLKKAEALKSLARMLPALQQAESNARTMIKRKAVEDMSDVELRKAARAVLKRGKPGSLESRFPLENPGNRGNTHTSAQEKNPNPEGSETCDPADPRDAPIADPEFPEDPRPEVTDRYKAPPLMSDEELRQLAIDVARRENMSDIPGGDE